ncbi:MAG: site-specific integrase [Polyangiaceae bacterium]|nr:site-specific integrase [Polyangiaceae bacterium]
MPLEWRRTYAVAAHTGLRPEESAELRWSDVDFAQGEIHVRRAWGWNTKRMELSKTQADIRSLPIEPELLPILKAMGEGAAPDALVVPLVRKLGKHKVAPMFRKHLQAAGGCRPAIFVESATHEMIGFRALRDTYCTWSAIDGSPIERVQTRAGHENSSTTRGYYREVEDRAQLRGSAFPPLACLAGPVLGPNYGQALGTIVEAPGSALSCTESTKWTEYRRAR